MGKENQPENKKNFLETGKYIVRSPKFSSLSAGCYLGSGEIIKLDMKKALNESLRTDYLP